MISIPHTSRNLVGAGESMTIATAMRRSWTTWAILLALPFFLFMGVLVRFIAFEAPVDVNLGSGWFLGSMIFLAVGTVVAFYIRSRFFANYYRGDPVAPSDYYKGMMVPWIVFEVAGILSLIGCLATNALFPCMIPAMVACVLFTTQWPKGHAMVAPVGDSDDPQIYTEPR